METRDLPESGQEGQNSIVPDHAPDSGVKEKASKSADFVDTEQDFEMPLYGWDAEVDGRCKQHHSRICLFSEDEERVNGVFPNFRGPRMLVAGHGCDERRRLRYLFGSRTPPT